MKTHIQKLFLWLALLDGTHSAVAQVSFTTASTPGVGSGAFSVASADINSDGKADLISVNRNGSTLTVLTNNGSGVFSLASSPVVGTGPYSVISVDFNGDGKMDLISANADSSTLTVLTNNGSGGFATAASPAVGGFPFSVAAADFNGDGKMDAACVDYSGSILKVLTNNGSGGLVLATSQSVGANPYFLTAADINNDSQMDIITANFGGNTLTVLTNNGSGNLVIAATLAQNSPRSVMTADVNGDGTLDLISANSTGNSVSVFINNGGGGFAAGIPYGVGVNPFSVAVADVNGDGKLDLVSANANNNTLTVLTNNGSGGFALAVSPNVGSSPFVVVAADFNGDDRMDLASANSGNNTLTVLTNNTVFPPPRIAVPATATIEATGPSGAVVNFSTSATNLAGGLVATTNTPASGSIFPMGTNTVTATATWAGSSTNQTFQVIVQDTTPPTLALIGANPLTNFVGLAFVDPGATATDLVAGNLTGAIIVTGTVNTDVVASYPLTYTVSDNYGNTTATNRMVVVMLPPPVLNIASSGNQTEFYWSASATNYVLQSTTNLASTNWVTVTDAVPVIAFTVTNQLPARFFRLQAQ